MPRRKFRGVCYWDADRSAHTVLAAMFWLGSTSLAGSAAAAEPEPAAVTGARAVTLNEEGARYYAARDYRRAVEKFIQAYAVDSDPNLLFNIASCYEGLGDLEAAVEKYREFLDAPDADPSGRPHAEAVIQRWERTGSNDASAPVPSQEPRPSEVPLAREAPLPVAEDALEGSASWAPWVVLGAGGVVAALGGTFYALGARDHSRVTDADGYGDPMAVSAMTRAEADELVDSGRQKKQLGAAGLAVGGALVASGVVWWLLDDPEPSESVPSIAASSSGATLTISGAF